MRKNQTFRSYFLTEKGRKIVFWGASTFAISLFGANFLPHTFFLKKYKEIVTSYNSGIEEPVPEKVIKLIDVACEKLNIHPLYRQTIKPFTVYGFDIFEAGSTSFRFGCALGIPKNFSYESENDIDRQSVRVRNEIIPWSSENGKLLEESLVLSENEKLFAICKSILQLDTYRVLLNATFPTATFIGIYTIGIYFNQRLNLYVRPLQLRMVMYSILGLFGLGTWAFLNDFNQVGYDTNIDKRLSALGPEFISAGISYYDKMLKRNIALRNLIDKDMYTARGNENFFIRQKHLPLTIRKSYFESKLKELKGNIAEPNEI